VAIRFYDPRLAKLRSHSRYEALIRRFELEP
jgi:hypothetical protein